MLDIGFGLIFYHILKWFLGGAFVLFVLVPFVINLFNGRGWLANVKTVGVVVGAILSLGFGKHSEK